MKARRQGAACFVGHQSRLVMPVAFKLLLLCITWNIRYSGFFVTCSEEAVTLAECSGSGCVTPSIPKVVFAGREVSTDGNIGSGIIVGTSLDNLPVDPPKHPVFMLPGIAGSGLMISATNADVPRCSAQPINYPLPFRLWASLSLARPPRSHQLCWLDIMQPTVDETGENYDNKKGLTIEVDKYGTAHGFDYLDYYYNERFGVPGTAYFHRMLRTFYTMGYIEGTSLVGIPYDWRLPPWQMDFARLKNEIEVHVGAMGGAKADLLVHSLGSIVCNYFLNKVVDQEWKNKYINSYTLIAPATGGSFKAIKAILTGYNDPVDLSFFNFLDVSLIPVDILRDLSRSMGSIFALLPDIDLYGKDHVVLRQLIPKSGSSSAGSPSLKEDKREPNAAHAIRGIEFRRLDRKDQPEMLTAELQEATQDQSDTQLRQRAERVQKYALGEQTRLEEAARQAAQEGLEEFVYTLGNWTDVLDPEIRTRVVAARERMSGVLQDPGVPTRCVWSVFGFPSTDISYIYTGTDISRKPIAILDVGDDTVPLRSLSVCTGWASTFEVKTFKNLDHMFIFGDGEFNNYIRLAFGTQQKQND